MKDKLSGSSGKPVEITDILKGDKGGPQLSGSIGEQLDNKTTPEVSRDEDDRTSNMSTFTLLLIGCSLYLLSGASSRDDVLAYVQFGMIPVIYFIGWFKLSLTDRNLMPISLYAIGVILSFIFCYFIFTAGGSVEYFAHYLYAALVGFSLIFDYLRDYGSWKRINNKGVITFFWIVYVILCIILTIPLLPRIIQNALES